MSDHDPAREDAVPPELRAAWRALAPPLSPDASNDADHETAAAVRWARDAWRALEVPAPVLPRARPRVVARRRPARLALAAAAALVLGSLGVALWRLAASGSGLETTVEREERASLAPGAPARVEILDVRPDQLELRSGSVRLVLVTPAGGNTSSNEGI